MMSGLSSHVLLELEQIQVLNEVLDDENTGEFSLDDDSVFDSDCTQLGTPGTHVISDRMITGLMNKMKMSVLDLDGCSVSLHGKKNMGSFPPPLETFCDVYGPQISTSELDVVSAFEIIFGIAVVQLIVDETNS
jgi:hypothetical protein